MADPSSPEPAGPPPSGGAGGESTPLDVLADRLRLPAGWGNRAAHGVLLLAVSVLAAFLVSPGLYSQQIPEIGPEDVGKPFRAASPSGFKARRDYEVVDKATTEQRRGEARAAVRPVFDHDPSVQRGIVKALQGAFGEMQEVVSQFEAEKGTDKGPSRPQTTEDAMLTSRRKRDDSRERDEHELLYRLSEARKRFEQHVAPGEDEDMAALAGARYSREVEKAAVNLVESAYRARITSSREELSRVDPEGLGIMVRVIGGSGEPHLSTSSTPVVMDVREAQSELERYASVPGNLLPDSPGVLRRAVLRLAKRQIRPNLTINIAETDARRRAAADAVKEAVITTKKGQKVIGDGELINETHLVVISSMRAQTDQMDLVQLQLGGAGLVALLIGACFAFHRAAFRRFRPTRKDALLLGGLLVGMLGLMHLWVMIADAVHDRYGHIPVEALYYCIPVAAGAALVRFLLSDELALFFAIVISSLSGVMIGNSLAFGLFALVGSLVAVERIARAKDRVAIFKAGVATGTVQALTVIFFSLAEGKGLSVDTIATAGFAFLGSAAAVPVVVMALTPLVESVFGYASDIKLLELANLNHPALKELIVQAPGTYHHSIIMGSLVESAAEAIGANPLLARSCAYYHDIGKGKNPLYFGENQKGDNRHDSLAPAMSAVIVKRHVTEGLEMARQYKLPKLVADAIPQHHGTRLVGFFFHKAVKEQEGKEAPQQIDETIYRYVGPKPQFREAALVMIADAVEAAARAMPEPTSPKLQAMVQKLINTIFSEGQLDECDLTLKDLNLIAQSFVRTLEGIYHARPAYPPGAVAPNLRPGVVEPVKAALSVAKPEGKRSAM
ncbi:MAG: HDIG domain-containing protein [Myxococcales bacterium]|nr:HDIG domain-containing protein [Myxococcales bacterium]